MLVRTTFLSGARGRTGRPSPPHQPPRRRASVTSTEVTYSGVPDRRALPFGRPQRGGRSGFQLRFGRGAGGSPLGQGRRALPAPPRPASFLVSGSGRIAWAGRWRRAEPPQSGVARPWEVLSASRIQRTSRP